MCKHSTCNGAGRSISDVTIGLRPLRWLWDYQGQCEVLAYKQMRLCRFLLLKRLRSISPLVQTILLGFFPVGSLCDQEV
jgi:hypothetical protein